MWTSNTYMNLFAGIWTITPSTGFQHGSAAKNLSVMQKTQETQVQSLDGKDPLEKGMATHSSILVWRIPWTEEPGGLQSMGSQRVRHDWSNQACMHGIATPPYHTSRPRVGELSSDSAVQFSPSIMPNSLGFHGLQHARLPYSSPTLGAHSNSCPSQGWCHLTISSFVIHFSSHLQSFPASGSFPVSWFFTSGGQSIRVSASASVLAMNIQDWFPLGWTGWISLQSKGLSRVLSNTTVQKHQFFSIQLSL